MATSKLVAWADIPAASSSCLAGERAAGQLTQDDWSVVQHSLTVLCMQCVHWAGLQPGAVQAGTQGPSLSRGGTPPSTGTACLEGRPHQGWALGGRTEVLPGSILVQLAQCSFRERGLGLGLGSSKANGGWRAGERRTCPRSTGAALLEPHQGWPHPARLHLRSPGRMWGAAGGPKPRSHQPVASPPAGLACCTSTARVSPQRLTKADRRSALQLGVMCS